MVATVVPCLLLVVDLAFTTSRADEPPSWEPFEVCSKNGLYCARVSSRDEETIQPWDRDYRIEVYAVQGAKRTRSWQSAYDYDGYPQGALTEDGRSFVYVDTWYRHHEPVVRIYRAEGRIAIPGKAFGIDESALFDTVSHRLWLDWRAGAHRLLDAKRLRIATLDGRVHVIDLETGRLSP